MLLHTLNNRPKCDKWITTKFESVHTSVLAVRVRPSLQRLRCSLRSMYNNTNTRRLRLNDPCATAMQAFINLLWPLVIESYGKSILKIERHFGIITSKFKQQYSCTFLELPVFFATTCRMIKLWVFIITDGISKTEWLRSDDIVDCCRASLRKMSCTAQGRTNAKRA